MLWQYGMNNKSVKRNVSVLKVLGNCLYITINLFYYNIVKVCVMFNVLSSYLTSIIPVAAQIIKSALTSGGGARSRINM